MDKDDVDTPKPADGSPPPHRRDPQAVMPVINGVLVGVGTLNLATRSVVVTIIGAVVALTLAGLYLIMHRS